MIEILQKLLEIGAKLGTLTNVHMYDEEYTSIEGVTFEGKKFSLSLHIKEEKEND